MKTKLLVLASAAVAALFLAARPVQDKPADPMAMFGDSAAYLTPNENHKWLAQFLGEWDVTMRLTMVPGGPPMESKGKSSARWLMDGRWLLHESEVDMFGQKVKNHWILGYDNFKKKYVSTRVNSFETCIAASEGFRDQSGNVLNLYGTIDEYLTGEHDKMVRYALRALSPDHSILEVHDLAIGETNTKVLEFEYTRRK
jgi:Protein of unknown function (DUF1579)